VAAPAVAVSSPVCEPGIETRRCVAVELLGELNWSSEARGFCDCPGQHLHTTGDGERDCEVWLDGAPTIHCFHRHCKGIIKAVNRELRSQIGRAEHAANSEAGITNAAGADSRAIELPEIVSAERFLSTLQEIPAELVSGMIHR